MKSNRPKSPPTTPKGQEIVEYPNRPLDVVVTSEGTSIDNMQLEQATINPISYVLNAFNQYIPLRIPGYSKSQFAGLLLGPTTGQFIGWELGNYYTQRFISQSPDLLSWAFTRYFQGPATAKAIEYAGNCGWYAGLALGPIVFPAIVYGAYKLKDGVYKLIYTPMDAEKDYSPLEGIIIVELPPELPLLTMQQAQSVQAFNNQPAEMDSESETEENIREDALIPRPKVLLLSTPSNQASPTSTEEEKDKVMEVKLTEEVEDSEVDSIRVDSVSEKEEEENNKRPGEENIEGTPSLKRRKM